MILVKIDSARQLFTSKGHGFPRRGLGHVRHADRLRVVSLGKEGSVADRDPVVFDQNGVDT